MRSGVKILIVLFLLFAVAGCCKRLYPVENTVHDTIAVTKTVRLRDTSIVAPGAGVSMMLPDSVFHAKSAEDFAKSANNKQAHLVVTKTTTGLHIDCKCDTVTIQAQLRDSLIKVDKRRQEVKTIVQERKYVPKVVSVLAWIGGIALLGIIGLLVKKFWL